jgi:hypothetical protein
MNSLTRQYIFGSIFVAVGAYQAWKGDFIETSLYIVAGIAFIMNALTLEPKLIKFKKALVAITWVFIAASVILFLYVLQFKF